MVKVKETRRRDKVQMLQMQKSLKAMILLELLKEELIQVQNQMPPHCQRSFTNLSKLVRLDKFNQLLITWYALTNDLISFS